MNETNPCPLCGRPLYGWIALPAGSGEATVGMPLGSDPRSERVIDRCEDCGVAVEHGRSVDLAAEWAAIDRFDGDSDGAIALPNRASLQAAIGVEGWAGIDRGPGSLLLTPRSLELLGERSGHELESVRTPPSLRAQGWMLQTLLNGLTFHPNFAREVRAGSLRPASARSRFAFAADAVVTVLGAPLVALVSVPLELIGTLAGRGGEMVASLRRAGNAHDRGGVGST
jgi:hypothetical protein